MDNNSNHIRNQFTQLLRTGEFMNRVQEIIAMNNKMNKQYLGDSTGRLIWDRSGGGSVYMLDNNSNHIMFQLSPSGGIYTTKLSVTPLTAALTIPSNPITITEILSSDNIAGRDLSDSQLLTSKAIDSRYMTKIDMSIYVTLTMLQSALENYYTIAQVDNLLLSYITLTQLEGILLNYVTTEHLTTNYYTKTQIDDEFSHYYTKTYIDTELLNYYTKNQVDSTFLLYYNKEAIDSMLLSYVTHAYLTANYYTKTTIDNTFSSYYYTKSEIDTNFYTKSYITTNYYNKLASDLRFATPQYVINYGYTKGYCDTEFNNRYTKTEADTLFLQSSSSTITDLQTKTGGFNAAGTELTITKLNGCGIDTTGNTNPQAPWLPVVKADGVTELGRIIDFHTDYISGGTDYTCRLTCSAANTLSFHTANLTNANISGTTTTANLRTSTVPQILVGGSYISLDLYLRPVGTIYTTADSSFNPNTEWGGTWSKIEGKFLYGSSSTLTVGSTGGNESLIIQSQHIPAHAHPYQRWSNTYSEESIQNAVMDTTRRYASGDSTTDTGTTDVQSSYTGTQTPFPLLPPYEVVNHWKRTA